MKPTFQAFLFQTLRTRSLQKEDDKRFKAHILQLHTKLFQRSRFTRFSNFSSHTDVTGRCFSTTHLTEGLPFGFSQGQISQIWHFLIALGLKIFGLHFGTFWPYWASLALNTKVWPQCYFLALFWPFLHERTVEVLRPSSVTIRSSMPEPVPSPVTQCDVIYITKYQYPL